MSGELELAVTDLEEAISVLIDVFGDEVARKPDSRSFNRAIFDFLAFYAQRDIVRKKMRGNQDGVRKAYKDLFLDNDFRAAVERDTAGVPNTSLRFSRWGQKLNSLFRLRLPLPVQRQDNNTLSFPGFKD